MNTTNLQNKEKWRSSVSSLLSIVIDYVVNNLVTFSNDNMDSLKILPYHIKNRILQKFTTSSYFWKNIDMKEFLSAIVNDNTYHVNLTSLVIDDDMLDILANSKNIQKLYLSRNGKNCITSTGNYIIIFIGSECLQLEDLQNHTFTLEAKVIITGLINLFKHTNNLRLLLLAHCDQINDSVLECLSQHCPNLMGLDVGGCPNITDAGLINLFKHTNNLRLLLLAHCDQINDSVLECLSQHCPNLMGLDVGGCPNITDAGLINLFKHTNNLRLLLLAHCDQINDSVLECLSQHCPNLMGLDVGGCPNITDAGMEKLSKLKNLTWLTLSSTQISDEGIRCLVSGPSGVKIKELRIENCQNITEHGLKAVADNCPRVEILMFHKCSTINPSNIMFQEQHFKNLKHVTWTFTW